MSYFADHYSAFRYPIKNGDGAGFRVAQLGAIHAVAAHFANRREPAIVTMPTGSGKTAVLVAAAFVLRPKRVLIIAPGRLVREQIADEVESLSTLRAAGAIGGEVPAPRVMSVKKRIRTPEAWNQMRDFDVIVGTVQSISPEYADVPQPDADLFDLVLVDEAHHSPARTWKGVLDGFAVTNRILFTATPFRQDQREIRGRFIFTYDLRRAFEDRVFGEIRYQPVTPEPGQSHDVAIASAAERQFKLDRAAGFEHRVMVRTDSLKRADAILTVYERHTALRLKIVTGEKSLRHVRKVIEELGAGTLDGIVCVNMLGEGFNFPSLKVAAIHSPHRSLSVTNRTRQHLGRRERSHCSRRFLISSDYLVCLGAVRRWNWRLHSIADQQDPACKLARVRATTEVKLMKNIVVCCDGTGNEISENISNVLKLYRVLRKTDKTEPRQVVFYDPGVGTLARPDPWRKVWQDAITVLGLATGYGLDENILAAYEFLINQYEDGDDIYLFGFSRGAYAVRVLAGLIHKVGLLSPQQRNLAGAGLTAYKQFSAGTGQANLKTDQHEQIGVENDLEQSGPVTQDDQGAQFGRIVSAKWPTIKFVGVWDTVASVIVPRPDRLYRPSLQKLSFTQFNPSVRAFRQAISIDERRRMFRLDHWSEPQIFMRNRFSKTNNAEPQDSLQVWFAGVHADIGGGYPERESGLSKFPLLWMIEEAVKCGLSVDRRTVNQLVWGVQRKGSPFTYVVPDFMRDPHNSMNAAWRILEFIPKADKYKECEARRSQFGCYIPNGEPRAIPTDAYIHESVVQRMNAVPRYRPINLPARYRVVPSVPRVE
jgi:uncharacterized protein (DUF2235 family)/superfamily II DNA or RNA helicase